jgi:benzoyl-CoA reductase/2-hydroxyglutaryl-CoA dehydratase subunit BcrC/BadD/HgdB
MIEFLTTCGFEADEIKNELPRIEKAFHRLGITAEDIERGKQRLAKYYDIELKGVRKIFGLCIKDIVNTILARDEGKKTIIYAFMAGGFETIGSTLVTKSNDIHVAMLNQSFLIVLGGVFDKLEPILEAAETKWLKSGRVFHCGNIKTMVGLLTLDLIPKPDMLVTSGQLCDTSPKTLDILHELYDIQTCWYETCQDRAFNDYPDSKRVVDLCGKNMRHVVQQLEKVVGFEITDKMILDTIDAQIGLKKAINNLYQLQETSDPLVVNAADTILWGCMGMSPWSISDFNKPVEVLNMIYGELKERVREGKGLIAKGAPRVLSVLPPNSTDPRQEHLVQELGIAEIAFERGLFPENRDIGGKINDPYEAMGILLESSLTQSLNARIAIIIETCKRLNVDGVIIRFHVGCRSVAGDPFLMKNAITEELGIPVLVLEWESFDPRIYNEEQLRRRLELFRDSLIDHKSSKTRY